MANLHNLKHHLIETDWLKRWNTYSPHAIALHDVDRNVKYDYAYLYQQSMSLAFQLQKNYRIEKSDRIAILATNEIETLFLYFAALRLGAVLVPINFRLTARELEHILGDCTPKLFIYQNSFTQTVEPIKYLAEHCLEYDSKDGLVSQIHRPANEFFESYLSEPEDIAMILYTSGTTGAPKGAMISNQMIFWNSINTAMRLNLTRQDSTIIFHPLFHTSGWNVLTTPLLHHGAKVLFLKKFDAAQILEISEKEKISILFGVPTMMDMMAQCPQFKTCDLSSIRFAIVGGEPMPIPLIETWHKKSIPVRQGYGLTEFGPGVFSLNEEHATRKSGSIGFPNFYVHAQVIDENHNILGPNQIGELALSGPMCTSGYWRNEKATHDNIVQNWFLTGDLVRYDEEGFFYVVGRKKDMFISGAENVYPAEIEQFLRTHPKIHEVAVIGVPDEKWGEVGRAFISTFSHVKEDPKVLETEILDFCKQGLAKYKIPKYFVFKDELPKGDSGKILKKLLKEQQQTASPTEAI